MTRLNRNGDAPFIDTRNMSDEEIEEALGGPARPSKVAIYPVASAIIVGLALAVWLIGCDPMGIVINEALP